MNSFRRWLLTILAVWGFPAFFFWLGVGIQLRLHDDQEIRAGLERLDTDLMRFSRRAEARSHFEAKFREGFSTLSGIPVASPEFVARSREFSKSFPPGVVSLLLFDSAGRLVFPADAKVPDAWAEAFSFIKKPWTEGFALPTETFPKLDSALIDSKNFLVSLKEKPGQFIRRFEGWDPDDLNFPTHGIFLVNDNPPEGFLGGILGVVSLNLLGPDYFIGEAARDLCKEGFLVGFEISEGRVSPPPSLSVAEFQEIRRRSRSDPSPSFRMGELLVEARSLQGSAVLFAVTRIPPAPGTLLGSMFLLYILGSFRLLLHLHRAIHLDSRLGLSLRGKLLVLFLLGVGIPLLGSTGLGNLFLEKKQNELLAEQRKNAFRFLDDLDQGLNVEIARLEVEYRRLCGGFGSASPDLGAIERSLEELHRNDAMEDYMLVSSGSVPIAFRFSNWYSEHLHIREKPVPERVRYLRALLAAGMTFSNDDWRRFLEPAPEDESRTGRMKKADVDILLKGFAIFATEMMSQIDASLGFPPLSTARESGLTVDGLMGEEGNMFFQTLKGSLERLAVLKQGKVENFHFPGMIRGPNGRLWYAVLLSHSQIQVYTSYLRRMVESARPGDASIWKAIGYFPLRAPSFPDNDDSRVFLPLIRGLDQGGKNSFSGRMMVDGREMEVCMRRGELLTGYFLVHATPVEVLESKMAYLRSRNRFFLVSACVFGLLLAWVFLARFLVPLENLAIGIKALREKRFDHSLPAATNDELGQLCREFNRARDHLREMELSSAIQSRLLPVSDLRLGNIELSGRNTMTQAIGGDFFDFIPVSEGKTAVVMGDVAGHGVSAALVVAMAKAAFTILCREGTPSPAAILAEVNRQFLQMLKRRKMMTCFIGILDSGTGVFSYANAGQCFPILAGKNGVGFLKGDSNPLGVLGKARFASGEVRIRESALVLYSDGLAEATNAEGKPIGYDRFATFAREALQRGGTRNPLDILLEKVRGFTDPVPWADDATLVLIREIPEGTDQAPPDRGV